MVPNEGIWDEAGAARLLTLLEAPDALDHGGTSSPASIGPYVIERVIGEGAAGRVYLGHRPGPAKPAAIKLMRFVLGDSPGTARVWRELEVLAELTLDCVPRVLDYGTHDGRLYIASEFIDGKTLEQHCEAGGLARDERVRLLRDVAEAVQEVHERGVIHRDLKPSNIIVAAARNGATHRNRVVVLDFGLARAVQGVEEALAVPDVTITAEGAPIGTPAFMAPEQARGDRGTSRSVRVDVFALGAIAYRLLVGGTPHDTGGSLHEVLRRVAEDEPRPVRGIDDTMPRDLARVLEKACAREPVKRYSSARELADEFDRWLRGEAVEAGGSPRWKRAARWISKHPVGLAAAASALLIIGSVAVAITTVWWINLKPSHLRLEGGGEIVSLSTALGNPVHTWSTGAQESFTFSQLVVNEQNHKSYVVLAFPPSSTAAERGRLSVADMRSPQRWLWTTPVSAPEIVPPGQNEPREMYVTMVRAADVFGADGVPEIIAIAKDSHLAHQCIRVYSLTDGRVLYEAWHWGQIHRVLWLEGSGLIIASGVTNRDDLRQLTIAECGDKINFPCVFALRPVMGQRTGWVRDSRVPGTEGENTTEAAWYYVAGSPVAVCADLGDNQGLVGVVETLRTSGKEPATRFYANIVFGDRGTLVFRMNGEGDVEFDSESQSFPRLKTRTGEEMVGAERARWRLASEVLERTPRPANKTAPEPH